jgi:hypothetical protein
LIHKFDKSDAMPVISSEDEDTDRAIPNKHNKTLSQDPIYNSSTPRMVSPFFKPAANESSYIESDSSILMINNKVNEMKSKSSKPLKKIVSQVSRGNGKNK